MTRTDIHRPSAPEFDPEGYECFGVFDLATSARDYVGPSPAATVSPLVDAGWSFSGAPHGSGQCSHCGTRIRYAALMGHTATKTLLYVGETCLDNRFALTKADFDALRKTSSLNRERNARSTRLESLLAEHPSLAYLSYAHNIGEAGARYEFDAQWGEEVRVRNTAWIERTTSGKNISTLSSIWERISRYAEISDRAAHYADLVMGWLDDAEQRLAAREAATAALTEAGVEVPEGRMTIEGTVLSTKFVDNGYGGSLKMLVRHESGWKVWGTVPSSIDVDKGSTVRFTATVTRSTDDALFGFYSRPTKAVVVA